MYLILKNSILLLLCCVCIVSFTETNKKDTATTTASVDLMKSDVLLDGAIKKSWKLVDKGQKLANQGKSVEDIIKTLPEGALVSANENSILFFIEGSIPMIIELDSGFDQKTQTKGGSGNTPITTKVNAPQSLATLPLTTFFSEEDKLAAIIGSERGDDGRQIKKALILAPFYKTDFKGEDDANVAYQYLKDNRNYKDNILFKKENITLEDFTSFKEYDLVHLSTHGENFCRIDKINYNDKNEVEWVDINTTGCFSAISTGIYHGFDNLEDEEQLEAFNLKYSKYLGAIYASSTRIYVKPLFFNYFYKTGITNNVPIAGDLKDKIWIFSACELGQNGMTKLVMEDVLEDSHFLYWENSVELPSSITAFNEFYENLIVKGLDANKAFEEIPTGLRVNLPSTEDYIFEIKDTLYKTDPISKEKLMKIVSRDTVLSKPITTTLNHLQTGDPRHGIEVIDMVHPKNENLVQQDDFYELTGDFNDGIDEAITLKVKLIGYTKAEFLEKQMRISLEVDGEIVLSKHAFLPDVSGDNSTVESIEAHEYGVLVTITEIDIPDVGTKKELTLKASLHLNNEKVSIHKETVSIVSLGIIATTIAAGKKSKSTYDGKRKASKQEIGSMPVVYNDDQGYKYMNTKGTGWMKVNIRKLTGTNANLDSKATTLLNYPLVGFALIFKINEIEKLKKLQKTKVDCDLPAKCSEFKSSDGVRMLFNPSGKLIEYGMPKQTIYYTYGNYDVILPKAEVPEKVKKLENAMSRFNGVFN